MCVCVYIYIKHSRSTENTYITLGWEGLPNQRKPRNHEGGGKMTKRNISEWLNVIKLKVKDWEKIGYTGQSMNIPSYEVFLQVRKKTIQKENVQRI